MTTKRTTQTPGAKKETTTTAQTSTDDVMDAVLGKASVSEGETQTTEPELPEDHAQPDPDELPAFDLDQLLKAGGIEAPKKKRWVQGTKGLELKEV